VRPKRTISYIPYSFCPNHTATIEALARAKFSGRDFRIILLIMRQTDGYLREEDQISPDYFARKTGLSKSNLSHAIRRLAKLHVITITPGKPPTYSVNPPTQWKPGAFVQMDESNSSKWTRTLVEMDEKQACTIDNLKITTKSSVDNRNDKYTKGQYGHMVARTADDIKTLNEERARRNKKEVINVGH